MFGYLEKKVSGYCVDCGRQIHRSTVKKKKSETFSACGKGEKESKMSPQPKKRAGLKYKSDGGGEEVIFFCRNGTIMEPFSHCMDYLFLFC